MRYYKFDVDLKNYEGSLNFIGEDHYEDNPARAYFLQKEIASLKALNEWKSITGECSLVAEHVEKRSLFDPDSLIQQGTIEMWVDMFKLPSNLSFRPKLIDITPRKPIKFQLRIIIFRTEEVILDDVNPVTGERTSDIYIKGFINEQESQKTDVHERSLNGDGNFNFRFIFNFEYLPDESKILYYIFT